MLFNKNRHKQQQQPKQQNGKPQQKQQSEQQRPETEDERWQRWANGKFHGFIFTDKGGRWQVMGQSDGVNSWLVMNTESIARDEVSGELLWRKLAQAMINRQRNIQDQTEEVIAFVNYTAVIREELLRVNKRVRSADLQAVIEDIDLKVFGKDGYPYPKKETA